MSEIVRVEYSENGGCARNACFFTFRRQRRLPAQTAGPFSTFTATPGRPLFIFSSRKTFAVIVGLLPSHSCEA